MSVLIASDAPVTPGVRPSASAGGQQSHKRIKTALTSAAGYLPLQGPITTFIAQNPLQAFEHLPFFDGIRQSARLFSCEPLLSEERYRAELGRGRIRFEDLDTVLREDPGTNDPVFGRSTRLDVRRTMLHYNLRHGPADELRWFVAETDALRRVRSDVPAMFRAHLIAETRRWTMRDLRVLAAGPDAPRDLNGLLDRIVSEDLEHWDDAQWEAFSLQLLWRVCCAGVSRVPPAFPPRPPAPRHRDLLRNVSGEDSDDLVHEFLIRYCAAFLDQGFSHWPLPHRDRGFLHAFCQLYREPMGPPDLWLRGLSRELARIGDRQLTPIQCVQESLELLGVPEEDWDEYITAELLALRGWAAMIWQMEQRPDRVAHPIPDGSLLEYLAVRLVLERFALKYLAREALNYTGPLSGLREAIQQQTPPVEPIGVESRAFTVFQIAQLLDWQPDELYHLDAAGWQKLLNELEAFTPMERRQHFHKAYERHFYDRSLNAIQLHKRRRPRSPDRPRFQVVCCLDDREESLRRHIEEVAPDAETFGAAGFYGVAMYYRGAGDAHPMPLCPIVLTPRHWVAEQVDDSHEEIHQRRAQARRAMGTASHRFRVWSRSVAFGAILAAGVGVLATIPLIARILFPRLAARMRRRLSSVVQLPHATRLVLERQEPEPGPQNGHQGFDIDEMAGIGERLLREIGLIRGFARLVFILGHGSNSLNNPHKSAYDCGACGGGPGGPNGRAIAQILNDPRVRERLAANGVVIPADTVFVGGLHDTCNESVTLYDIHRLAQSHQADLNAAERDLTVAGDRNAHERSRRYMSAPLTLTAPAARLHVEERSEDLAQTRPELGHATNALCIIARRERTRGLFLDRRAFLTSYDPTQDDSEASVLTRILQAAIPVCGGINLNYFFSHTDNSRLGCGTKLPHNITAQVGVMDGAASDLRTGMPWQTVEIHEPIRLLIVIETTPQILLRLMDRFQVIGQAIRNGWVRLALLDPDSGRIQMFENGTFSDHQAEVDHLPTSRSSVDWYRGWRENLEFAEIEG